MQRLSPFTLMVTIKAIAVEHEEVNDRSLRSMINGFLSGSKRLNSIDL